MRLGKPSGRRRRDWLTERQALQAKPNRQFNPVQER
jgi:hypothetical protein